MSTLLVLIVTRDQLEELKEELAKKESLKLAVSAELEKQKSQNVHLKEELAKQMRKTLQMKEELERASNANLKLQTEAGADFLKKKNKKNWQLNQNFCTMHSQRKFKLNLN